MTPAHNLTFAQGQLRINNFNIQVQSNRKENKAQPVLVTKANNNTELKKCVRKESNKNFYCYLVAASSHKISAQFFKQKKVSPSR